MKIYLLRHGLTAYNKEKRYQGTRDIPLCDEGRRQLAPALICPDRVYVSPLVRARETAEILFPHTPLTVVEDLREMCFGIFEGRNYIEMEHDPDYISWVGEDCTGRCPGGETRGEFSDRSCAAFVRLVEESLAADCKEIAVMAHGGTQMAVMERFALPQKEYYHWCSGNAGGYLLDTTSWKSQGKLTLEGEVSFLVCPQAVT